MSDIFLQIACQSCVRIQDINMGAALPKRDGKVAPKLAIAADTSEKTQFLESPFTRRLQVIGLFDYTGRNEYNVRNTPVDPRCTISCVHCKKMCSFQEDVGRFTLKEAVPWQAGHSIMIKMRKISRSE